MSRLSIKDLERLNTWTPEIARCLRPDAPVKQQPNGSLRLGNKGALVIGPASGLWYDHEASKGGTNALSLIRYLTDDGKQPASWADAFLKTVNGDGPLPTDAEDEIDADAVTATAEIAKHILETAVPIDNTPAQTYLRGRGIQPPYPDNLRFVKQARLGEGALVAVVEDKDGPVAIQLTYLDGKGRKSTIEPERRTYGIRPNWASTAQFALSAEKGPAHTVIAEGVEDALSLWKANAGKTIIACLGIGNLGKAPVADKAEVIVFRDGDEAGSPSEISLANGIDRLILAGATVRVTDTPEGEDANSLFSSAGASRLTQLIADAPKTDLSCDGWIEKCARMDRLDYEQKRAQIARDLNIRVAVLDEEVNHRRRDRDAEANDNDYKLVAGIENIEPWPDEVELKAILDSAAEAVSQYVHMPPTAIDTIILWAAHTHILDRISVSPRLAFQSPGPGCGKTVSMEATANLVPRPISAASITSASTFRIIEAAQPTLCIDEADQLFRGENADLLAVMNSSHRRSSAFALRTVEVAPGQHEAKQFSTWAPVMFAGIRNLPATLQDRSIVIRLQRALPGEVHRHLRDGRCPTLLECGRKLARWAQDFEELPDLALPPEFSNRVGDNWRPLFAIAELAGGDWPNRVMAAARSSLRDAEMDQGIAVILLRDIMSAFGDRDRMASQEILDRLLGLDDGPYQEANRGRPITAYWLAQQLKGVISGVSRSLRIGQKTAKGYYRHQFEEAWRRYAVDPANSEPSSHAPKSADTSGTTAQSAETVASTTLDAGTPDTAQRHTSPGEEAMCRRDDPGVTAVNAKNSSESAACDVVTPVTPVKGRSDNGSSADPGADAVTDPLVTEMPDFLKRTRSPQAGNKNRHAPNLGAEGRAQDEERW